MGYTIQKKHNRYYALINYDGKKKAVPGGGYFERKDAEKAAIDYLYNITRGLVKINRSMTVEQLIDLYLKKYQYSEWSKKQTSNQCQNHIIPLLGKIRLDQLSRSNIEDFKDHLLKIGGSIPNAILSDLRKILNWAVDREIIPIYPHFKIPSPPKRKKVPPLTREEIFNLIEQVDIKDKLIIALGGCHGLRPGEIAGLRWSDIDTKNMRIMPTQQHSHGEVKDLKTEKSEDMIPLLSFMVPLLNEYKRMQGFCEYLFPSSSNLNKPMYYSTWEKTSWKEIKEQYSINPGMRLHDLRHSHGYNVMLATRNAKLTQRLMRHKDIKTTLNIYGYVFEDDMQEGIAETYDLVEKMVEGKKQIKE